MAAPARTPARRPDVRAGARATSRPAPPGHVAVVGGGLAGIAAAASLADRGWRVTLLESRPRLGGAAYSFRRGDLTVDTGVHVVLRCYTAYRALLARIGVAASVPVQPRLDITVLRRGEPPATLRRGRFGPAPVHLLPAIAGYRELTVSEKLLATRAALAVRRLDLDDPALDRVTLAEWLRRRGLRAHAIDSLWGLLCVAALNIDPDRASMALMAQVLRTALLDSVAAGDIGVPGAPLSALHDEPARRLLRGLDVTCRVGSRVTAIDRRGAGFAIGTRDGELTVDAAVCAVPHRHAAELLPGGAVQSVGWSELDASPIVNVHLLLDRVVTGDTLVRNGFAAVLRSPLQWLFDRTAPSGARGQYLVSSLSAADRAIGRPAADLIEVARREIRGLFPAATGAELLDAFVTREPHATIRQQAGTAGYRPSTGTYWRGLVLAGSWTATGLPDTLEGAVRSGQRAAEALTAPRSGSPAGEAIDETHQAEVAHRPDAQLEEIAR